MNGPERLFFGRTWNQRVPGLSGLARHAHYDNVDARQSPCHHHHMTNPYRDTLPKAKLTIILPAQYCCGKYTLALTTTVHDQRLSPDTSRIFGIAGQSVEFMQSNK